jgi:hypothetical protein
MTIIFFAGLQKISKVYDKFFFLRGGEVAGLSLARKIKSMQGNVKKGNQKHARKYTTKKKKIHWVN